MAKVKVQTTIYKTYT